MTSRIDLLCAGMTTYDFNMTLENHPPEDDKVEALDFSGCGGGPAANAAAAAAGLGGRVAFLGYLGWDMPGELHLKELEELGVECRWITRGNHPTRISCILAKADGTRTVVAYAGSTPVLTKDQLTYSMADHPPRAMLCDGHEPEISLPLARTARELGVPLILDAGSLHRGTKELLPFTDYLVCSRKFAAALYPDQPPEKAVKLLGKERFAVVTLGKEGGLWSSGTREGAYPAFPVKVVDSTGAGDIFHGTFALEIARGKDPEKALVTASAAAACCCGKLGARRGIPTPEDIKKLTDPTIT